MHNKYQPVSSQTDYLKMNSTESNITNLDKKTWANEGVGEEVLLQRLIEYYMDAFNINDTAVQQIHDHEEVAFNIDKLNIHQYIVLGWLSLFVAVIGIIGNSLTIKTLIQPRMKNVVNTLMTGLAISDLISLILIVFLVPMRYILVSHLSLTFYEIHAKLYPYIYPLTATLQFNSIYLVVSTCTIRMLACYFPSISSKINRPICYKIIVLVFLFSLASCAPLWFKFEVDYVTNANDAKTVRLYLKLTEINYDPQFRFYLHIYYILITYVIPLVILMIMNYLLIISLLKSRRRKHLLGVREQNEIRVSLMLMVLVGLFFFCQLPNLVLHVLYAVNMHMGNMISQLYMTQWANFLLIVNSSFNFTIYCLMSSFRKEVKRIFFREIYKRNSLRERETTRLAVLYSNTKNTEHTNILFCANQGFELTQYHTHKRDKSQLP